jgi:hypothetical protein
MTSMDAIRAEIERRWDEEHRRHHGGLKPHELRDALQDEVEQLLSNADRDVKAEAARLIMDETEKLRRKRRGSLRKNLEHLLDAFAESAEYVDPLLDLAYPIGTPDGETKLLRYWTEADYTTSTQMSYRNAAETTAGARVWDGLTQAAIDAMRARGVDMFGDIFAIQAVPT